MRLTMINKDKKGLTRMNKASRQSVTSRRHGFRIQRVGINGKKGLNVFQLVASALPQIPRERERERRANWADLYVAYMLEYKKP